MEPPIRESFAQRLVAGALRRLLRATLLPTFRADRPFAVQRRRLARIARLTLVPRGVRFEAGAVGGVAGEWITPASSSARRVILYLHGGGYCVGSPATHRAVTGRLARLCGLRVFAPDYRLAPEHPHPAAVDDAVAACRGLPGAGWDARGIVLAGDSAGGGLALATAMRLRDLGLPLPAGLLLFSPWVDLTRESPVATPPDGEVMLSQPWLEACVRAYLAGRSPRGALVSPLFADLSRLPRTLIQVGSDELLHDDAARLHQRLRAAGTESTLHVYAGRWHVFQLNAGLLADANQALREAAGHVSACFGGDDGPAATRGG